MKSGQRVARVKTKAKIDYTYDGEMTADIWNGPSFAFVPKAHAVEVQFLPWHRAWSHSFTLAALLGLITGVLFGSVQAGLVAFLGMSAHIVEDQLGYLGSNLFWPITKERSAGARLLAFRRCDSEFSGGVDGAGADPLQPRSVFGAGPEPRAAADAAVDLLHARR